MEYKMNEQERINYYFELACMYESPKAVNFYINKGADLTKVGYHAFIHVCRNNYLEKAKLILKNINNLKIKSELKESNALNYACQTGNIQLIQFLIDEGFDVNSKNDSAIVAACMTGNMDVVNFLIKNGANLNARINDSFVAACRTGNIDLIKFVYSKGLDLNNVINRALGAACCNDDYDLLDFMIENGLNINDRHCLEVLNVLNYSREISASVHSYLLSKGISIDPITREYVDTSYKE